LKMLWPLVCIKKVISQRFCRVNLLVPGSPGFQPG